MSLDATADGTTVTRGGSTSEIYLTGYAVDFFRWWVCNVHCYRLLGPQCCKTRTDKDCDTARDAEKQRAHAVQLD